MFNNFFHDFTAALWLASSLVLLYLNFSVKYWTSPEVKKFYLKVFPILFRGAIGSLVINLILGVFRAMAYVQYEYLPAAGKGQIVALIFKHVLIGIFLIGGTLISWRLLVNYKKIKEAVSNG